MKNNSLQKKITKNQLLQNDTQLIRVLDIEADRVFVIDCIKKTMPVWKDIEAINEYVPCSEDTLQEITDTFIIDLDNVDSEGRKTAYERYTMIAPLLPFISDLKKRKELINSLANINSVSKQTIRYYLCLYLVYQNISILGGSDSFTIIGTSGIGKSSAISRAISLITENRIIETDKPYTKIIPCLIVQCPFDSSVKGLLLEILRKVDEELGTDHYIHAVKSRASTTDMLIGAVSSIALNNIGMLVVDEIQNVVNSKNGKSLIGALTQLINNSGISICMVGTPESTVFFEQAMQLARRSVGLQYTTMNYDDYFQSFCKIIFKYQFLKEFYT